VIVSTDLCKDAWCDDQGHAETYYLNRGCEMYIQVV
jgi:hypothetical protein